MILLFTFQYSHLFVHGWEDRFPPGMEQTKEGPALWREVPRRNSPVLQGAQTGANEHLTQPKQAQRNI
jgi:hypothetical protein